MYQFLVLLLVSVQLLCMSMLWLSCFPGALVDAELPFLVLAYWILTYPIVLVVLAVGVVAWMRHKKRQIQLPEEFLPTQRSRRYPKRLARLTGLVIVLTLVLLKFNLPQWVAFAISRPAFEAFIAEPAKVETLCRQSVKPQLGLYQVKDCDRDSRGGIYFQTGWHGFLFDSSAYGFVYQPNPKGSDRFGTDSYEYGLVVDDWYWFRARDDW